MDEESDFDDSWLSDMDRAMDAVDKGWRGTYTFWWFASDCEGRIATFATAGFSAIPSIVLDNKVEYMSFLNSVIVHGVDCSSVEWEQGHGEMADFVAPSFTRRGFFYFDGLGRVDGIYTKLASPTVPLTLSELSEEAQSYLRKIQSIQSDFTAARTFDANALGDLRR